MGKNLNKTKVIKQSASQPWGFGIVPGRGSDIMPSTAIDILSAEWYVDPQTTCFPLRPDCLGLCICLAL